MKKVKNYTPLKIGKDNQKDDLANTILLLIGTITAAVLALLLFLLIKRSI